MICCACRCKLSIHLDASGNYDASLNHVPMILDDGLPANESGWSHEADIGGLCEIGHKYVCLRCCPDDLHPCEECGRKSCWACMSPTSPTKCEDCFEEEARAMDDHYANTMEYAPDEHFIDRDGYES